MTERLSVRDALLSFAAREPLRAALFLTYSFDGGWFEEAIVPELLERPIATMLVVRDRNAITREAPSVRYHRANAYSSVFHPKLALLVAERQARAVISSANLTRSGFALQRELGRVFDLSPSANANRSLFASLADYLENGVAAELRGSAARSLADTVGGLRELLKSCKAPDSKSPHVLLHNYDEPIWTQLLNRLPHRVLRRAAIVSPFFEPDRRKPEDPALGPEDDSIFARFLHSDFRFEPPRNEKPVRVYFRHCEGRTELPVQKLSDYGKEIAFLAQDERQQRLHAKLILLEGAGGEGREPYLVAVHGSPNFTSAGLLSGPPNSNSELAVLTGLVARRKSFDQAVRILGLDDGFNLIDDLSTLQADPVDKPPNASSHDPADVTYHVGTSLMKISFFQPVPAGATVCVLLQRDGAFVTVGEVAASGTSEALVVVTGMAEIDAKTRLLELRGSTVRIEVRDSGGDLLSSLEAPVNVDVPDEFCGMTLVGASLLTLDERIAREGIGAPPTYREQQNWIERRKSGGPDGNPLISGHQADLDRFYRNVHHGLRGILARFRLNPDSEFTYRRSLDELTRWTVEAASNDGGSMTRECRIFLVERLLRGARSIIERASSRLRRTMPKIAGEICIAARLEQVVQWLDGIGEPALQFYAESSRVHVQELMKALSSGADH